MRSRAGFGTVVLGLSLLLGQTEAGPDSTFTKYFKAGLKPDVIFGTELSTDEISSSAYYEVTFSPTGEVQQIRYFPAEKTTGEVLFGDEGEIGASPPFIPLTPEQQAALNPENKIIQNAAFLAGGRFGVDDKQERGSVSDSAEAALADEQAKAETKAAAVPTKKNVIAVFQVEAPELSSDSMNIVGEKRQRIVKSAAKNTGYFRHWNVTTGIPSGPLDPAAITGAFYQARFDDSGILSQITHYLSVNRPVRTYTFDRDSIGLYTRYSVRYHVRTSLIAQDPYRYAPAASDIRPGWTVKYQLDPATQEPERVAVYDQFGVFMYRYRFEAGPGRTISESDYSRSVSSYYYASTDSLLGWHRLWYRQGADLARIEYYRPPDILISAREFQFNPVTRELLITSYDEAGRLLDRRLKAVR